jgi:hypothetical protein
MAHLFEVKGDLQADALRERDRFLGSHPELKELQDAIDSALSKADSSHNRLVVIHNMMMDSFLEMHQKLQDLIRRRRRRR